MENNHSDICVILPTYNRIKVLNVAIESLLNQSDKYFDLLIIDNCSTDGTWDLICKTKWNNKGNNKLVKNDKNYGAVGSAKIWSKKIDAFWATVLCDDDWLDPDFIRSIKSKLTFPPKGLIVVGHARCNEFGETTETFSPEEISLSPTLGLEKYGLNEIKVAGISSFAIPSSIFKSENFPKNYPGGFCEDGFVCLEAICEGGLKSIPGIKYFRREWDGCESKRKDRFVNEAIAYARFEKDINLLLKKHNILLKKKLVWQKRPLISSLAYFARAIYLHGLTFAEIKKYLSFSAKTGLFELFRAILCMLIFCLNFKLFKKLFVFAEKIKNQRRKKLFDLK